MNVIFFSYINWSCWIYLLILILFLWVFLDCIHVLSFDNKQWQICFISFFQPYVFLFLCLFFHWGSFKISHMIMNWSSDRKYHCFILISGEKDQIYFIRLRMMLLYLVRIYFIMIFKFMLNFINAYSIY